MLGDDRRGGRGEGSVRANGIHKKPTTQSTKARALCPPPLIPPIAPAAAPIVPVALIAQLSVPCGAPLCILHPTVPHQQSAQRRDNDGGQMPRGHNVIARLKRIRIGEALVQACAEWHGGVYLALLGRCGFASGNWTSSSSSEAGPSASRLEPGRSR
jgi:hypothetical protein